MKKKRKEEEEELVEGSVCECVYEWVNVRQHSEEL